MLNYVMLYFLAYLLSSPSLMQAPGSSNSITPPIASNAHLPLLAGTHLRINVGFLIALACAFGVWWLLNRTTTGFEFRRVGANPQRARVAGMNVERNWALVMLIAGGLAGLAASSVILGTDFTLNPQSYGTYGIDAITVALLGLGQPGGVVAAGLLFGALHAGSPGMQTATGTPVQIVQVIQALIVLFVAAPPLVRAMFRLRGARAARSQHQHVKGVERVTTAAQIACPSRWLPAAAGGRRRGAAAAGSRRPITYPVFGLARHPACSGGTRTGDATFSFTPEFAKVIGAEPDAARRGDLLLLRRGHAGAGGWCGCSTCSGSCGSAASGAG